MAVLGAVLPAPSFNFKTMLLQPWTRVWVIGTGASLSPVFQFGT